MSSDLDRKSKRVLEALFEYGGEADMGEIKEYTGIEKNGVVHYRLKKKLEPMGLVETEKANRGDGSLGVTVGRLTDEGEEIAVEAAEGDSKPSLAEQVTILKGEVENLHDRVELFEGFMDEFEDRLERIEEQGRTVEEVEEVVEEYEGALEDHEALIDTVDDLKDLIEILEECGLIQRGATRAGGVRGEEEWRESDYVVNTQKMRQLGEIAEAVSEEGSDAL